MCLVRAMQAVRCHECDLRQLQQRCCSLVAWVLLTPCVFRGYGTVWVCLPHPVQLWVVLPVRHCQLF